MTEQHPLTDEMIEDMSHLVEVTPWYQLNLEDYDEDRIRKGFRAAYDLGRDEQLKEVIKWIKDCDIYELGSRDQHDQMISDLKKAMRPTT